MSLFAALSRCLALGMLVWVVPGGTGCGDCAGVGAPAFRVQVLDAGTGAEIAQGATLYVFRINSSIVLDSISGHSDIDQLLAAWDQTGRFDLIVEKAGYFAWTLSDVEVVGDCTVETVSLIARLRRRLP